MNDNEKNYHRRITPINDVRETLKLRLQDLQLTLLCLTEEVDMIAEILKEPLPPRPNIGDL